MLKFKAKTMIFLSGFVWFFMGTFLMWKGMRYLEEALVVFQSDEYPLLSSLYSIAGGVSEAIVLVVFTALLIGVVKGRFVLGKSACRGIARLQSLPEPILLSNIYPLPYYGLYAVMMGMGMAMSLFKCPHDIRGFVDIAVGSALLNGSLCYFRASVKKVVPSF